MSNAAGWPSCPSSSNKDYPPGSRDYKHLLAGVLHVQQRIINLIGACSVAPKTVSQSLGADSI
jgi:hypothetical protein